MDPHTRINGGKTRVWNRNGLQPRGQPMSTNVFWTCCLQCTSSRVGCFLCTARQPGRTVRCALCAQTEWEGAEAHHRGLWECACTLLSIPNHQGRSTQDTATLPLSFGGLGLRSALRTSPSAFWSWADCLLMINARHPAVADMITKVGWASDDSMSECSFEERS